MTEEVEQGMAGDGAGNGRGWSGEWRGMEQGVAGVGGRRSVAFKGAAEAGVQDVAEAVADDVEGPDE